MVNVKYNMRIRSNNINTVSMTLNIENDNDRNAKCRYIQ